MAEQPTHTFNPESNLDAVIAEFLRAREAGDNPDPEAWIEQHPELANDLREFFADHARLEEMSQVLRQNQNVDRIRYFGDYELHEEIARGGMGVVYRARQVSVNRPVAVKMILAGQFASENDVQRFRNEAELAANLDHPHIVPIHEVGEHQGQHYFSMKLIEGDNLSTFQTRYLDRPKDAARLMIKIANAVHHAHQRGLLHRDLKPGNVLIDVNGEPHVTDFGLAKRIIRSEGSELGKQELTQSGAIVGTPAYASPEQVRGEKALTTASDVYGLGAILYVLLTGKAPFENENVLDTIQQVMDTDPVRPQSHNPRVPRDLQTICLKCMAKEPQRRYDGADQLADELQRFCNGEPIEARRVRPPERVWRWCRRHPAVASLLALVVVLLVTGSAISTWFAIEASRRAAAEMRARHQAVILASSEAELKREAQEQALREIQLRENAQKQALRAETARHAIQVSTALRAWKRNDLEEAERILSDIAPEFAKTWEVRHLRSLCNRKGLILPGGTSPVANSLDGRFIATGSLFPDPDSIILWSFTGEKLRSLKGDIPVPDKIAFSHDGKFVAASGFTWSGNPDQESVQVWSTTNGKLIYVLTESEGELTHLAFSPDGTQIVTVVSDLAPGKKPATATLWNAINGKQIRSIQTGMWMIDDVAFSAEAEDVQILAVDANGWVRGWSTKTGKETFARKAKKLPDLVAFGPGGKYVASTVRNRTEVGSIVEVAETVTGKSILRFKIPESYPGTIGFSPDGRRIILGLDSIIQVRDASTGQVLFNLRGPQNGFKSVEVSAEGRHIVSSDNTTVRVWEPDVTQEAIHFRPLVGLSMFGAVSPDGNRLANSDFQFGNNIHLRVDRIVSGEGKEPLWSELTNARALAFSPDGNRLITSSFTSITVWSTENGMRLFTLETPGPRLDFQSLAVSRDGKRIAQCGRAQGKGPDGLLRWGEVRIWEAAPNGKLLASRKFDRGVGAIAFAPNRDQLAVGILHEGVRVWDTVRDQITLVLEHTGLIASVVFSPDGKQIACAASRIVRLWNSQSGEPIHVLKGHTKSVTSVAFSPDGTRIVTGSWDKTIKLWDTATGQEIVSLKFDNMVKQVRFTRDGNRIVSLDEKGQVKVWDSTSK